jgi:hypothetical protein
LSQVIERFVFAQMGLKRSDRRLELAFEVLTGSDGIAGRLE